MTADYKPMTVKANKAMLMTANLNLINKALDNGNARRPFSQIK